VDYGLELEAEFPHKMVTEMQGNAARKAHRTMIDRTLGGKSYIQSFPQMSKAPLTDVLHFNNVHNPRILYDLF
jgi:hypothetical protein